MRTENARLGVARRSECPWLVSVTADRLWMYPAGAYCRRPDRRVRVPASGTLANVCATPAHIECAGYCASVLASAGQADLVARVWGSRRLGPR